MSDSVSVCLSVQQPYCFLKFLCLVFLAVRTVMSHFVRMSVCLPVFHPVCLSLWDSVLVGARLPSFTVKCSADWRGQFSNGAALPLIFCLSLGVRLIYRASSPADIQIHFDGQLDRMTPTSSNTANITAAARVPKQSNAMFGFFYS